MRHQLSLALAIGVLAFQAKAANYIVQPKTASLEAPSGIKIIKQLPLTKAFVADLDEAEAKSLAERGYHVEPDSKVSIDPPTSRPDDLAVNKKWAIDLVKSREANRLRNGRGFGVTVCVVDTGVKRLHPQLRGKVVGGVNTIEEEAAGRGNYTDVYGHGTVVASIVAGKLWNGYLGVAPRARIYAVKALGDDGSGTISAVAEGIRACFGKASVINLSLGTVTESEILRQAAADARARGITLLAASGNSGGQVQYPARYPTVVAVGAINQALQISEFSCRGRSLDFVAPGEDVPVLNLMGRSELMSGTSFAVAYASGVEAIRRSRGKLDLLARDLSHPRNEQGQGLIDAELTAKAL